MYSTQNFKSKKELKEAVDAGKKLTVFNPGNLGAVVTNGKVYLEGPHYPQPHKWYAQAWLVDGFIVRVK